MLTAKIERASAELKNVIALAQLLERLEGDPTRAGAGQYQLLVRRLSSALQQVEPGAALQAVLSAHPATAELYENLHYAHAGLCRSPLGAAIQSEQAATGAIGRARRNSPSGELGSTH